MSGRALMGFKRQTTMSVFFIVLFSLITVVKVNELCKRGGFISHMFPVMIDQHRHLGKVMQIHQATGENQKKHETGYYAMHQMTKVTKTK